MAGYSKGIVDTRKLNKNNKAGLGRGGDTKIREVDGRESHVNALEAYLIDVNGKAGEEYAKRVGAGTINPLTGMPEYQYGSGTEYSLGGRQDYETLSNLSPEKLEKYSQDEFGIGADKMQYIEPFTEQPFHFLRDVRSLAEGQAVKTKGFTERGLTSAYGTTMGELGSREASLGLKGEGLTAQQTALGRAMGSGITQATKGEGQAMRKSNMAFSGTITQGYETQKKQLFQDYTAETQDIGRERAGIDIAMGDIGRQRGTALETLNLGKEMAASDLDYTEKGAKLDYYRSEYEEKKRQLDQYYADVGSIPA